MIQKGIGTAVLVCGILLGSFLLLRAARERESVREENGSFAVLGAAEFMIFVLATLGISDYLLNTILYQKLRLAEDKKLPGTLVAAGLVPSSVMAFSLLRVENPVELRTLLVCCVSIAAGAVLGTRLVGRMDGAKIRRVMGIALIGSMIALIVKIIVSEGEAGTATGLTPPQLAVAVVFSVFWGIVNMIGVPMKPAGTAFFLILGMSPLGTLTLILVMGSIGPMSGAVSMVKSRRYHQKLCCAAVLFGVCGAVLGILFTITVNATVLNVLLIAVMLVAIVSLLRKPA